MKLQKETSNQNLNQGWTTRIPINDANIQLLSPTQWNKAVAYPISSIMSEQYLSNRPKI